MTDIYDKENLTFLTTYVTKIFSQIQLNKLIFNQTILTVRVILCQ